MTAGRAFAALALALSFAGPLGVSLAAGTKGAGEVYLVVGAPWADVEAVVAAAGGRLTGPSQPLVGRVAAGGDDGFPRRLRRAGAWLVVGNPRLLSLCGVRS